MVRLDDLDTSNMVMMKRMIYLSFATFYVTQIVIGIAEPFHRKLEYIRYTYDLHMEHEHYK